MADVDGLVFGLILAMVIIFAIVFLIAFSIRKVSREQKENKPTNPLYIVLIVFGILFFVRNELIISLATIIVGIIGNIYNYKDKQNKYFVLSIIVYSMMLIYGVSFLVDLL